MNTRNAVKLSKSFYTRDDVVEVARDLLGKYLCTDIDGVFTSGKIVETEAYNGRMDKACHAFLKRTKRTEIMYQEGGIAYVYLCYGIHHLFNIVTNVEGLADAVLVRALEPMEGVEAMQQRRGSKVPYKKLTAGPGTLSQALGIHKGLLGTDLAGNKIWLAEGAQALEIETDVRIGIDYAGEDALLPWRFMIKDHPFVSVKKKAP